MQGNEKRKNERLAFGEAFGDALALNFILQDELAKAKIEKKYIRAVRLFILRRLLLAIVNGLIALKIEP